MLNPMNKNEVQFLLAKHKPELMNKFGVIKIGFFGSFARNEQTDKSDIDVAVELQKADLFLLVALKNYLQSVFEKEVDIIRVRENMNKFLKDKLQKDIIYV